MVCNIIVSCMALVRYDERSKENKVMQSEQTESSNVKVLDKNLKSWQKWMDKHYDDAKMKKIYPECKTEINLTCKEKLQKWRLL